MSITFPNTAFVVTVIPDRVATRIWNDIFKTLQKLEMLYFHGNVFWCLGSGEGQFQICSPSNPRQFTVSAVAPLVMIRVENLSGCTGVENEFFLLTFRAMLLLWHHSVTSASVFLSVHSSSLLIGQINVMCCWILWASYSTLLKFLSVLIWSFKSWVCVYFSFVDATTKQCYTLIGKMFKSIFCNC